MTKEDLQKMKNDSFMKFMNVLFGKNFIDNLYKEVETVLNEKEKSLSKKDTFVTPNIKVEPTKMVFDDDTIWRKIKINKDNFEKFLDAFSLANDTVASLETNGFMFTEDSPIVMYENLIAGLLESIFGKNITKDIIAYVYGDSNDKIEDIWNRVEKNIKF